MKPFGSLRLLLAVSLLGWVFGAVSACGDDGGGDGGGDSVGGSPECETSSSLSGGWQVCDGELFHRSSVSACGGMLDPREDDGTSREDYDFDPGSCFRDNHCTEHPNGYCFATECLYLCGSDADCGDGEACFCLINQCVPADCSTDADCPGANACAVSQVNASGAPYEAACQTSGDTCRFDSECGGGGVCLIDGDSRRCGILPN